MKVQQRAWDIAAASFVDEGALKSLSEKHKE